MLDEIRLPQTSHYSGWKIRYTDGIVMGAATSRNVGTGGASNRRWRCWLAIAVASLVLGVIMNITVAWALALWGNLDIDSESIEFDYATGWYYPHAADNKCILVSVIRTGTHGCGRVYIGYSEGNTWEEHVIEEEELRFMPTWARYLMREPYLAFGQIRYVRHIADARGWPLLSLASHSTVVEGAGDIRVENGIPLVVSLRDPKDILSGNVALPLKPLTFGFVFNTMFYGGTVLGSIVCTNALRRRIRRKAGKCVTCGYSLRGIGQRCPECGYSISSRELSGADAG